jgi:hypothetical protein
MYQEHDVTYLHAIGPFGECLDYNTPVSSRHLRIILSE